MHKSVQHRSYSIQTSSVGKQVLCARLHLGADELAKGPVIHACVGRIKLVKTDSSVSCLARMYHLHLLSPLCGTYQVWGSVIFVNENENGEKQENNEFVNKK